MKLCYIAGHFRGANHWEIHKNVIKAELVIPHLIELGYAPVCPHKITENLQGLFSDQTYLDICLNILDKCDSIYMLKGWNTSEGSREEWDYAVAHKKEILYEDNDG
jgi:hypothetical protein